MRNCMLIASGLVVLTAWLAAAVGGGSTPATRGAETTTEGEPSLPVVPVEEHTLLPLVTSVFDAVADQRVDDAMQILDAHAWVANDEVTTELRTAFEAVARKAVDYRGTELVAVRRVSPRMTELFTFAWFKQGPILFRARFFNRDGRWLLREYGMATEIDSFVENAPLTFVSRYRAP